VQAYLLVASVVQQLDVAGVEGLSCVNGHQHHLVSNHHLPSKHRTFYTHEKELDIIATL
jgi:hypothetical protein